MHAGLRPLSIAAALCFGLAGCAVEHPDLDRMTADMTPVSWQRSSLPAGSIVAWDNFWARWQDPILTSLLEKAFAANPDIATAAANLRAAEASITSANAALWPTASLGADAAKNRSGSITRDSFSLEGSGGLALNLAGSEFWKADQAELSAAASRYSLEDVRAATAAAVAEAYVNLRAAEAQLEVVKKSLANYLETAETSRWQFEAGTGAASEAEDAMVQLASARARIPTLEGSIIEYRNALMRLAATPVEKLDLGYTGVIPLPPEDAAVAIPAETIANRPDVRAARLTVEAAVAQLRSAKSDFFPTLNLSGNIGTTAATVSALGTAGTGVAGLAAALSLPVFNWGSLIAQEESAAAEVDRSVASYRSTLLTALEETDNAIASIANAERRRTDLARAVEHARTAEMLARQEYEAGIGDYTMLLSTQRSLLSAEESELSNRADRAAGYIRLYRALGGAWAVDAAREKSEQKNQEQ